MLLEFSPYVETPILTHSFNLLKRGFKIVIAHVERYEYLSEKEIIELKNMGVYLQINASSLLKKKRNNYKTIKKYLKLGLIDFLATDSHNLTNRKPNLRESYYELIKIVGKKMALDLVHENQKKKLLFS